MGTFILFIKSDLLSVLTECDFILCFIKHKWLNKIRKITFSQTRIRILHVGNIVPYVVKISFISWVSSIHWEKSPVLRSLKLYWERGSWLISDVYIIWLLLLSWGKRSWLFVVYVIWLFCYLGKRSLVNSLIYYVRMASAVVFGTRHLCSKVLLLSGCFKSLLSTEKAGLVIRGKELLP